MTIKGHILRVKRFGRFCAVVLEVNNELIRMFAESAEHVQEGDLVEAEGNYRYRDSFTEFHSKVLRKC